MTESIRRTLIRAAVVSAVVGVLVALLAPKYLAYRFQSELYSRCTDFQRALVGIHHWDASKGRVPDVTYYNREGTPCYSWRLAVSTYIESFDYEEEAPWDGARNKALADYPSPLFCNSLDWRRKVTTDATIFAVSGPGTAFDTLQPHRFADLPADLVILIEVADSGTHWMAPGDLDVREVPDSITKGTSGNGVIVTFADGTVWFLSRNVPIDDLQQFFTIRDAQESDREELLRPYVECSITLSRMVFP